jgi:hypothetical protein
MSKSRTSQAKLWTVVAIKVAVSLLLLLYSVQAL